jgi:hypothetical protein
MSIQPLTPDEIEFYSLETHPSKTYTSSSVDGVSGAVNLFARRSATEKNIAPVPYLLDSRFQDKNIDQFLQVASQQGSGGSHNNNLSLQAYMQAAQENVASARKNQTIEIDRFEPPYRLNSNTLRKLLTVDTLMPYYRTEYPTAQFGYNNFNSLNFFTTPATPQDAALMYPSKNKEYAIDSAFSFDFWINPRYSNTSPSSSFDAGTIFHLSSSYAVSLISGSSKDVNGYTNGFKLLLQLSHSADFKPSSLTGNSTFPRDLVFETSDNALTKNKWHHVSIRWDAEKNAQTGSVLVDGVETCAFPVPYTSLKTDSVNFPFENPSVLMVGNFYEGANSGSHVQSMFFANNPATRDGLINLQPSETGVEAPQGHYLRHPLNAEIQEIKLYKKYISSSTVASFDVQGISTEQSEGLLFYLPPFFNTISPTRTWEFPSSNQGGVPLTPFYALNGSTEEPFNTAFSFGVGGHDINLENFVRDYGSNIHPRLWALTGSSIPNTAPVPTSANDFLYATGSSVKRNMLIAPSDNGRVFPVYDLFGASIDEKRFTNDVGIVDPSWVNLRNLYSLDTMRPAIHEEDGSLLSGSVGATPDDLSHVRPDCATLTVLQRTRDNTSNQVTFFDISNMFYGNQIKPGSLTLTDTNISGSAGVCSFTLKDDGRGNLYRADSSGALATWNSVGNVFYNEGIVMIKSPHLFFFGKDQFEISFKGVQNIHTMKFNLLARSSALTNSNNPTYDPALSASFDANQADSRFVYMNGVTLHDENLNVIMRTNFAQPVLKRFGDKIMIISKFDC